MAPAFSDDNLARIADRLPGPGRSFLFDLDGTLIRGGTEVPGAGALIRHLAGRFAIVSNNSTHTPEQLARELSLMGLPVPADRLVLAGDLALHMLQREMRGAAIFFCGSAQLQERARKLGLNLVSESRAADVVLLARDTEFTYRKLCAVVDAVCAGAALFGTNPDRTHPGPGSEVVPETGALLGAVLACTGTRLHRIVGKPEPFLFLEALRRLDCGPSETLLVGDNAETDGAGAQRLGIPFLLADTARERDLMQFVLEAVSAAG